MNWIKTTTMTVVVILICVSSLDYLAGFIPLDPSVEVAILTKISPSKVSDVLVQQGKFPPRVLAHPYYLYDNNPQYFNKYGAQHDKNRFRENGGTTVTNPELKLLAIGGSTTYGYGVDKPQEVWTNFLQQKLSGATQATEVMNGGLDFATSAELLARYSFYQQWIEHDVLIIHTGGNELLPISSPEYRSDYMHVRLQTGQTAGKAERFVLERSNIIKVLWGFWQAGSNFGLSQGYPDNLGRLPPDQVMSRVNDPEKYEQFRKNIETMITLALSHGRKVILIPFRNNHYDPSYNNKHLKNIEKAITVHHRNIKKILSGLAKKMGVGFVFIPEGSISQGNFTDNCHLNVAGQKEKAQVIFDNILPLIK